MFVFLILDVNVIKDEIFLISSIINSYKLSRLHLLCNIVNEEKQLHLQVYLRSRRVRCQKCFSIFKKYRSVTCMVSEFLLSFSFRSCFFFFLWQNIIRVTDTFEIGVYMLPLSWKDSLNFTRLMLKFATWY